MRMACVGIPASERECAQQPAAGQQTPSDAADRFWPCLPAAFLANRFGAAYQQSRQAESIG